MRLEEVGDGQTEHGQGRACVVGRGAAGGHDGAGWSDWSLGCGTAAAAVVGAVAASGKRVAGASSNDAGTSGRDDD
jgi:hypothetical protein